jgi:hypothetical protein
MSVSCNLKIFGVKPKDEKFENMLGVYRSCQKLGLELPQGLLDYFGVKNKEDIVPSENGVLIDFLGYERPHISIKRLNDEDDYGKYDYIIDLTKIPSDVKQLKVAAYLA